MIIYRIVNINLTLTNFLQQRVYYAVCSKYDMGEPMGTINSNCLKHIHFVSKTNHFPEYRKFQLWHNLQCADYQFFKPVARW